MLLLISHSWRRKYCKYWLDAFNLLKCRRRRRRLDRDPFFQANVSCFLPFILIALKCLKVNRSHAILCGVLNFLPLFSFHVVPPSVPVIYNEQNEPIESRAGPYEESGQLILTCVVMGGEIIGIFKLFFLKHQCLTLDNRSTKLIFSRA